MKLRIHLLKTKHFTESRLIHDYQSALESLMYAMMQTQFNIAFIISTLSQYAHNSDKTHWKALKWVLHYIWEILDIQIEYSESNSNGAIEVLKYSDFNWDSDQNTRQFTSNYVFQIINESVFWWFKHQKTVALFSCKTEYMMSTEVTKKAM